MVLDAASELLVRWGYQRVTMEDVASQAGIGKGTLYLHFRTKEALFLTVLLRGYRSMITGITGRMRADPREVLPSRMMRSLYLALLDDPVARTIYFGDTELLGRLAREAASTLGELRSRGIEIGQTHFELLRQAGLLRTDLALPAQLYLLDAIGSGFYFVEPLELPFAPAAPAARADVMAHAVAAALEPPNPPTPTRELAAAVADLYESQLDHIDEEWQRRLR
jgi:AcrR family transcriptional regulator